MLASYPVAIQEIRTFGYWFNPFPLCYQKQSDFHFYGHILITVLIAIIPVPYTLFVPVVIVVN